jgi:hypothetical protein
MSSSVLKNNEQKELLALVVRRHPEFLERVLELSVISKEEPFSFYELISTLVQDERAPSESRALLGTFLQKKKLVDDYIKKAERFQNAQLETFLKMLKTSPEEQI